MRQSKVRVAGGLRDADADADIRSGGRVLSFDAGLPVLRVGSLQRRRRLRRREEVLRRRMRRQSLLQSRRRAAETNDRRSAQTR